MMKKYSKIFSLYKDLYHDLYNVYPEINYAQCSKLIVERLENQTEDTICKIIKLYFENEQKDRVFHLPAILSAYAFNKYLPKIKLDPRIYTNTEENGY